MLGLHASVGTRVLSSLVTTATSRVLERLVAVRARTVQRVGSLSPDEQLAQPFPDASSTKWHLGHTSWLFERFVLAAHAGAEVDPHLEYVFNSDYEAVGTRQS